MDEFHLYETVEEVSKDLIMKAHLRYKPVCANVDFYSGFCIYYAWYSRENYLPDFLRLPVFPDGVHRLEELVNKGKLFDRRTNT